MLALQYPFNIDLNGRVAITTDYAQIVRGQLIDVLMTNWNERVMRPSYGSNAQAMLFDPSEELQKLDAAKQVSGRINTWTPRVLLRSCEYAVDQYQVGRVYLDITYRAGALAEETALRLPVSAFLSAEELV